MVHAGIDVSAKTLHVAAKRDKGEVRYGVFDNTLAGHKKLAKFIRGRSRSVRVCVEATGLYSLDLSLHLSANPHFEVMVVNPRAAKHFGEAQFKRSKDDTIDSELLLAFVQRMAVVRWMDLQRWTPPEPVFLVLRAITRRMSACIDQGAREKNRLHAAKASKTTPQCVLDDIADNIAQLKARALALEKEAEGLIKQHEWLKKHYRLLVSVAGIARRSGVRILGELVLLDPEMTSNQVVAYAGLDVRRCKSGTSIHKKPRISKVGNARLRAGLYMPAMNAITHCVEARVFYDRLVARGKVGLQPMVAVMRKLLVAIWNMFGTETVFDASRFCGPVQTAAKAA